MDNKARLEKYRWLSITALVTGLLSIISFIIIVILSPFEVIADNGGLMFSFRNFIIFSLPGISLPVTAIVCGSIDLKRIKAGRYSNKGKGLDITGIVLGSVFLLPILLFIAAEISANRYSILDIFFNLEEVPSPLK
jgi:energy-converting hydrogenase Eha subunit A